MTHNRLLLFEEINKKLSRKEAIKRALKETPKEMGRDAKLLKPGAAKSIVSLAFKAPRAFYRQLKKYTVGTDKSKK